MALGSKAPASFDNNYLSRVGSWRKFVGPRCLLGKVKHSHGVWKERCSQTDGDRWSPKVCWRYLVGARIGWARSLRRSRSCGGGKKQLTWDQRLLEIFGPRPMSVGEFWSGTVSVEDIWSRLMSVEYIHSRPRSQEGYHLVTT